MMDGQQGSRAARAFRSLERTLDNGVRSRCPFPLATSFVLVCILCYPGATLAAITFSPRVDYDGSFAPIAVATGDLNNDAIPDVVVSHYIADSLSVYFGNGDGTFQARKTSWATNSGSDIVIGNFNNDAWADVAMLGTNGFLALCLGDGSGIFSSFLSPATGPGNNARMVGGYLNLDAHLDLVVTNNGAPGAFYVMLGNGDGTFQPYTEYAARRFPFDISLGDFTQDGALDLAVTHIFCCPEDNIVTIFPGGGDGTFDLGIETPTCGNPYSIANGDLNGDTKLDYVVSCPDERVAVRLGVGDGTFISTTDLLIAQGIPSITLADFSGDGELDVAVVMGNVNTSRDSLEVFPGNGNGFFGQREKYEVGKLPNGIAAGDLNGDTQIDLVTANEIDAGFFPQNGSLSVLLNCAPCIPTSISVALQDTRVEGGAVHLRWVVHDAHEAVCTVLRRTAATDWVELGRAAISEAGLVAYDDHSVTPGGRYAYRLSVQTATYQENSGDVWILVPAELGAPLALRLDPVYPNPFQTQTHLNFATPGVGTVRLAIFDVAGRHVMTVLERELTPGWRSVSWDGRDRMGRSVPSGAYFAKLESAGNMEIRKIVVAR